jgi:hypothetical protein
VVCRSFQNILTLALATLIVAWAGDAQACKLAFLKPHVVDPARQTSDSQPPRLTEAPVVTIHRGMGPTRGCDGHTTESSCGDAGTVVVSVSVADDQTPAAEVGFRVGLRSGRLPSGLTLPPGDVRAFDGRLFFNWTDGASNDQESFAFVITIAPIDTAGNLGPATEVAISDGGSGCSTGRGARSQILPLALLLLCWATVRVWSRHSRR